MDHIFFVYHMGRGPAVCQSLDILSEHGDDHISNVGGPSPDMGRHNDIGIRQQFMTCLLYTSV